MISDIFKKIESIIGKAYLVGGAIRDEIMNRDTFDIDVATPLSPDEVQQKLKDAGIKTYLVGKRFGTIGCKINEYDIQITTFRGENYEPGSRKPIVRYIDDVYEDLSRRDFTMNAIAKNSNETIDPFSGTADISSKTIRSVGDPNARFTEDPLRMLRAFRFASELGFSIEEETLNAINKQASHILHVSKERINAELDKIMIGEFQSQTLAVFTKSELLKYLLPELYLMVKAAKCKPIFENTPKTGLINVTKKWRLFVEELAAPLGLKDDQKFISETLHHIATYYRWSKKRLAEIDEN